MATALPPNEVFEVDPSSYEIPNDIAGAASHDIVDTNLYCPSTGGMFVKLPGELLPRKCLSYPAACDANTVIKRITLVWLATVREIGFVGFIFKRHKLKRLERLLDNYNRLVSAAYMQVKPLPYLKPNYYCEFSRALWQFTEGFLTNLKFDGRIAQHTAKNAATIFEYEDAYRFVIKDVLAEVSLDDWLAHPQRTLNKLINLVKQRSVGFDPSKFVLGLKLLKLMLLVPKLKQAFNGALKQINYNDLQADVNDRFWCLIRVDWLFGGLPANQRKLQLTKEDYNPNIFVWRKGNYTMSEEQTAVEETLPVETTPEAEVVAEAPVAEAPAEAEVQS